MTERRANIIEPDDAENWEISANNPDAELGGVWVRNCEEKSPFKSMFTVH